MSGQNSNFVISDVTIAKPVAKFYHYDVIMAKFENLASQIFALHIGNPISETDYKNLFCFVAVNRQTISFVFLLSFSNPDHNLSKL